MADASLASGPAIECRDLTKRFGQVEALQNIDLVVPSGMTFGLLGRNGAGKTTSIRLWLGLAKPASGTACILAVYGDPTVGVTLAFFGRCFGLGETAIDRRTDAVLQFMDIADRRHDLVSTSSGVTTYYGHDFAASGGLSSVMAEYDSAGTRQARYTHGPGADEPVGLLRSGSHFKYQRDGLGSITRILDSGKNPVNTYDYDPWGLTTASGSCKRHLRRVDLLVALRESL